MYLYLFEKFKYHIHGMSTLYSLMAVMYTLMHFDRSIHMCIRIACFSFPHLVCCEVVFSISFGFVSFLVIYFPSNSHLQVVHFLVLFTMLAISLSFKALIHCHFICMWIYWRVPWTSFPSFAHPRWAVKAQNFIEPWDRQAKSGISWRLKRNPKMD